MAYFSKKSDCRFDKFSKRYRAKVTVSITELSIIQYSRCHKSDGKIVKLQNRKKLFCHFTYYQITNCLCGSLNTLLSFYIHFKRLIVMLGRFKNRPNITLIAPTIWIGLKSSLIFQTADRETE